MDTVLNNRLQIKLVLLYLGLLLGLAFGILENGKTNQLLLLFYYAACFVIFFVLINFIFQYFSYNCLKRFKLDINMFFISAFTVSLFSIAYQIYSVGQVPLYTAFQSIDYKEITLIRQNIVIDSPSWENYLTSLTIRAFLPLLNLLALVTRRKYLFIFSILLSVFFCCSLMQKSYIALVFLPAILFAIVNYYWKQAIGLVLISLLGIFILVYATNPNIRPFSTNEIAKHVSTQNEVSKIEKAGGAIFDRVFILPGQMISNWFSLIPAKIPYGSGCGDRVLAKFLGCEHINYSLKVYEALYSEQLADGIVGSVNVASFMEGYANFGVPGLFLSALELAFWFACICMLLNEVGTISFIINLPYILLLSSASLHTLIFSGGWALVVILIYLLRDVFKTECDLKVWDFRSVLPYGKKSLEFPK